ncbi:MAG: glycosyltransferase [Bacteroidetes bacterium]|nr:MAG: glycosyltransferase [Bacteroidota bacterium]
MINVVHISKWASQGGASRAMQRLHKGLIKEKITSSIYSIDGDDTLSHQVRFIPDRSSISKIRRHYWNRSIKNDVSPYSEQKNYREPFTHVRTQYRDDLLSQLPKADVYNLHWISNFIDIPSFFENIDKPVVWTLHDMNPFTGGCHYDNFCGKYEVNCGACPQLGSNKLNDLSKKIFEEKRAAISKISPEKLRIVTPSNWLAEEARKSKIFSGHKIQVIHNSLDHNLFKPRNKNYMRTIFEIPESKKVVLFGAFGINNRRKGYKELLESLFILNEKRSDVLLLSFGHGNAGTVPFKNYRHLGSINDDLFLSMIYNLADVFVMPSLQENLGQTCLEALSCGVPCVAFDTGGNSDMVINGETGYLASAFRPDSLSTAIEQALMNSVETGKNGRKLVETKFTLKHQAENYIQLYRDLLK